MYIKTIYKFKTFLMFPNKEQAISFWIQRWTACLKSPHAATEQRFPPFSVSSPDGCAFSWPQIAVSLALSQDSLCPLQLGNQEKKDLSSPGFLDLVRASGFTLLPAFHGVEALFWAPQTPKLWAIVVILWADFPTTESGHRALLL